MGYSLSGSIVPYWALRKGHSGRASNSHVLWEGFLALKDLHVPPLPCPTMRREEASFEIAYTDCSFESEV
jgi:hypothetical protein